jgi:hypothetical protein
MQLTIYPYEWETWRYTAIPLYAFGMYSGDINRKVCGINWSLPDGTIFLTYSRDWRKPRGKSVNVAEVNVESWTEHLPMYGIISVRCVSNDSRNKSLDLNPGPTEYKAGVFPIWLRRSVPGIRQKKCEIQFRIAEATSRGAILLYRATRARNFYRLPS